MDQRILPLESIKFTVAIEHLGLLHPLSDAKVVDERVFGVALQLVPSLVEIAAAGF